MLCEVYDHTGKFIRRRGGEPICGVDFCDRCGDCLHCYGGDPCHRNNSGKHRWVKFDEPPAD